MQATTATNGRNAREARRLLRATLPVVRVEILLCLLSGLAWQIVAVAVPWVLERVIDDGIIGDDRTALWTWSLALAGLGALRWCGDAARHWWVERAGARAATWLRRGVVNRILVPADDDLGRFGHGDLTARAVADTEKVWVWVSGLATYVTAGFTLIAVLIMLLRLDPALAIVGLCTVPLAALLSALHVRVHGRHAAAVADETGAFTTTIAAGLSGIRAVKGLGAESTITARVVAASQALHDRARQLAAVEAWWIGGAAAIPAAGLAAGLWLGGLRAIDGTITVGALVAFAGWMALLVDATETLAERLIARGAALAAAGRLQELLASSLPHPTAGADRAFIEVPPRLDVAIEGIAVVRSGRMIVAGVGLDVPGGRWLAIVGPSGGGKSTLLWVVAGLDEPHLGRVLVGGRNLHGLHPSERRRLVTLIPQNPILVSGTVADALRLGAPDATEDALDDALAAVAADDIVQRTGGVGATIGDRGLTLSGGQRQRLALAAAVLRPPPLLLLDDSTSALDPDTEARVLAGLRRHLPTTTLILATHRRAAASACDAVVLLADGGVTPTQPTEDEMLRVPFATDDIREPRQ